LLKPSRFCNSKSRKLEGGAEVSFPSRFFSVSNQGSVNQESGEGVEISFPKTFPFIYLCNGIGKTLLRMPHTSCLPQPLFAANLPTYHVINHPSNIVPSHFIPGVRGGFLLRRWGVGDWSALLTLENLRFS
jgi:hypothetical protein